MSQPARAPRARSRRPTVAVPANACDTHAHVFAPAGVYPYAAKRPYTPAPDCDLAAHRRMLADIGFERAVLVHSNIYGPDNRATTDALAEIAGTCPSGADCPYRGIALIRPDVDDATLGALAAVGMRGIRINLEMPGELDLDGVEAIGGRLADRGWHLQILSGAAHLPAIADRLRALPLDVVIDHMALPTAPAGLDGPGFPALLRLLETGKLWVKLSAPYYADGDGGAYPTATAIATRLWQARPDRMLFGTNWPHPHADPVPDEGDLVDWIATITGPDEGLHRILVTNPAQLYGFETSKPEA